MSFEDICNSLATRRWARQCRVHLSAYYFIDFHFQQLVVFYYLFAGDFAAKLSQLLQYIVAELERVVDRRFVMFLIDNKAPGILDELVPLLVAYLEGLCDPFVLITHSSVVRLGLAYLIHVQVLELYKLFLNPNLILSQIDNCLIELQVLLAHERIFNLYSRHVF